MLLNNVGDVGVELAVALDVIAMDDPSKMKIRSRRNLKSVATEDLPVVKGDQLKPKRR